MGIWVCKKTYGGKDGAIVVDCTDTMELSISTCVEVTLSTEVSSVTSRNIEIKVVKIRLKT